MRRTNAKPMDAIALLRNDDQRDGRFAQVRGEPVQA